MFQCGNSIKASNFESLKVSYSKFVVFSRTDSASDGVMNQNGDDQSHDMPGKEVMSLSELQTDFSLCNG